MKIILLGPPGSGKGTYAQMLEPKFKRISTGDLLRHINKNTKIGKEISDILSEGRLVPDDIVIKLIEKEINKENIVFDGFPRTLEQAKLLDKITTIDKVVLLKVSDDIIIKRLAGRMQCLKCGRVYHIKNNPPKKKGICDNCFSILHRREDENAIKKRLKIYNKNIKQIYDYYNKKEILYEIDAERTIKEIFKDLEKLLNEK